MGTNKPAHPSERTDGSHKAADTTPASSSPSNPAQSLSLQTPTLQVSTYALAFPTTSVGKPHFLTFTLAQHYADTPVTISTDAPDLFQLASDSRPAFASSLTIAPPQKGTYIHVRYASAKAGKHKAQLVIEAPYGSEIVHLSARSAGLLPAIIPGVVMAGRQQPAQTNRWRGVLALFVAGCLLVAGYRYRCELAPSLCREPASTASQPQAMRPANTPLSTRQRAKLSASKTTSRSRSAGRSNRRKARESERKKRVESTTEATNREAQTKTESQPASVQQEASRDNTQPAGRRSGRPRSTTQPTDPQSAQRPKSPLGRRTNTPSTTEESELEHELNKNPDRPF
ncbi:hypothetical protein [Spirosoma utsteinense]|uniref:Uncharacterized protein n=1 Tax=Spirosoma utsteinense TaxID=2585773 RepID=A0ABR6W7Y1_9BACT|nr:hypothetical protein [Spirosoma utsteinense]MBC3787703.1 hypothetical protein [Spirosoma utsteinense]MBC3792693.1 hypothetical protein [Spirosoma utsteinense]